MWNESTCFRENTRHTWGIYIPSVQYRRYSFALRGHLFYDLSGRCIDFVFYYPNQRVPFSGSCGLGACGGDIGDYAALDAESDFDRTFGIVENCTANAGDDSEVSSPCEQWPTGRKNCSR